LSQVEPTSEEWGGSWENNKPRENTQPQPQPTKALLVSKQLDPGAPLSSFGKPLSKQYSPPSDKKANLAQKATEAVEEHGLEENSEASNTKSNGDSEPSSDFEQLKQAFIAQRRINISQTETEMPTDVYPTVNASLDFID
jgi:hypothetical protein